MENKKMTKVENFMALKGMLEGKEVTEDVAAALIEFIDTQVEQIEAKAEKAKVRAAEKRAKGDELRDAVQATLTNEFQDIASIMSKVDYESDEELTNAKISARLTQLVKAGIVEKEQQKNEAGKKCMTYRLIAIE